MYKDLMDKLMMQQDLTRDDLFQMISDVVTETMTAVQIMGFQMAFLMKEPTPEELAWYVEAMQANSHKITVDCGGPLLDIAGTGDGEQPGKLYAGAAILAAAGGVPVVKQIRRAQKGYYGSEEVFNHHFTAETMITVSQLLLTKRVNLNFRVVPGGNHSEASWEKQVPVFMSCLGL